MTRITVTKTCTLARPDARRRGVDVARAAAAEDCVSLVRSCRARREGAGPVPSGRLPRFARHLGLVLGLALGGVGAPAVAAAAEPAAVDVEVTIELDAGGDDTQREPARDDDLVTVTQDDAMARVSLDDLVGLDDAENTENTENTETTENTENTTTSASRPELATPAAEDPTQRRDPGHLHATPRPLVGPRPSLTLTPRAQYWVRGESRLNADFDPAPGDRRSAVLQRVRLGLLAESGPVRAYVELQDARQWGVEPATIANQANVDLHQGYLEIAGARGDRRGYVRVGRQEIEVGSRRLFVDANWHPLGRSFDAIRGAADVGRFGVDAGFIVLDPPRAFTVEDPSGEPHLAEAVRSRGTFSYYAQGKADFGAKLKAEGLILGISERPSPATPTAERDIVNAGVRLYGAPLPGLTYDVEAYGQGGRNLGLPHRAWAAFATAIYTFPHRLRPALSLRYNYASGEACTGAPEDGCGNAESREFFRFFGLRHARYGILNNLGHSNLRNLEVGAHLRPHEAVQLDLGYHFFQLDAPTGRWRAANDDLIGAGWDPTNTSRDLGHEVDLTATIRPREGLFIQPGYGVFVPLEAAQRIAGPEPQHYFFLWMIAKF